MVQERAAWAGICVALLGGLLFFAWAWRDEVALRRMADQSLIKTRKERDRAEEDLADTERRIFHLEGELADARTQLALQPDSP